jgi:hypothetical protein
MLAVAIIRYERAPLADVIRRLNDGTGEQIIAHL